MAGETIRIEGLREFRLKVRAADRNLAKGLRKAGNRAANIVVDTARPRVPIGPGIRGHAASSIKAASTQSATRVSEGGARFPYMPWLDFGGTIRPRGVGTEAIRRPFLKTGRYIWAAFDDEQTAVEAELRTALGEIAREAGLDPI